MTPSTPDSQADRSPAMLGNHALLEALRRLPVEARVGPELCQALAVLLLHIFSTDALHPKSGLDD